MPQLPGGGGLAVPFCHNSKKIVLVKKIVFVKKENCDTFFIDAFRIFLPDAGLVFGAIAVMGALSNNDNNRFYFQIKNMSVVNHIRLCDMYK